jgi:hypothetical protein
MSMIAQPTKLSQPLNRREFLYYLHDASPILVIVSTDIRGFGLTF